MNIELERIVVVRLTRLEAVRVLVEPRELQTKLREYLAPRDGPEIIDGESVVPALPARVQGGPSPRVKRLMRKFSKGARRVQCPHCELKVKPGIGYGIHLARKHPEAAAARKAGAA